MRHFRAFFFGFTDLTVEVMGISGDEGRGCRFTSLSCLFTLSCAILNNFSSKCFSHAAFSVLSLILIIVSRRRLAHARRQRSGGSLIAKIAVGARHGRRSQALQGIAKQGAASKAKRFRTKRGETRRGEEWRGEIGAENGSYLRIR